MRGQPKLIQRNDSPYWFIYIPKKGKQRAIRLSTGEADYSKADEIFTQWKIEGRKSDLSETDIIQINDVLIRYADHKEKDATVQYHIKHLTKYFEGYAVSAITDNTGKEYTNYRCSQFAILGKSKSDRKVSPSTVRREIDTFNAAMKRFVQNAPILERPKASPPREKWLTEDELNKLIDCAERDYLKTYLIIARYTAARPSSILELKWFQVDLENRIIHFNPDGREQTKKYRPSIYINDLLLEHLIDARDKTASEYVISTTKQGFRVYSIKRAFKAACERAGIEGATPYTLRHTAITLIIRQGFSLAQAGQVAGHMDPRTTMRYAKHDHSFTRDAVESLATGAQLAHKGSKNPTFGSKTTKNKVKIQCT